MDFISISIIGIGLAMDCFAVSISKGICAKKFNLSKTLRMAFLFGLFQAIMPLIGFYAGIGFSEFIKTFDHWVAFGLLSIIGIKMIVEGLKLEDCNCDEDCKCKKDPDPFRWKILLSLALATSIDALATGVVFVPYPNYIWKAIAIIGSISFTFACLGMVIGIVFGKRFTFKVEILGGVILVLIGTKILIEHLFA
jgi:manganese efflux pump family protein